MRLLFCFLLFSSVSVVGQQQEVTPKQLALDSAKLQVNALKNGILLVRLDYKTREVAYYEKYENYVEAEKIKEKQANVNKEIMNAFQKHYSFSPVYYFSMDDSRKLLDAQYAEIDLLDQFGRKDSLINLVDHTFFVAEFGVANQDGMSNADDTEFATKMAVNALVIRDSKLVELKEPFPYHVTYSTVASTSKRYLNPVKKWQEKLEAFLNE